MKDGPIETIRLWLDPSSFFLERVPQVRPCVSTSFIGPIEPKLRIWINCMDRLDGGLPLSTFGQDFLDWRDEKIVMIEDHPYAGMDFRHDRELDLPPEAH